MNLSHEREIRERIEAFLSEISALVQAQALEAAREHLAGERAPSRARRAAPRSGRSRADRPRGAARRALAAEAVLDHVRANAGQRIEQIAEALGATTRDLKPAIAELLSSGSLRTEGQRRGTRYFVRTAARAPRRERAARRAARGAAPRRKVTRPRRIEREVASPPEAEPIAAPEPADATAQQLEPTGAAGPAPM